MEARQIRSAEPEGPGHQCRGHSCCESQRFHSKRPISRKPFHTVGSHTFLNAHVPGRCGVPSSRRWRALGRATASTGHKTSADKAAQNCTLGRNERKGGSRRITGRRQSQTCRTSLDVLLQCIPARTSQARRLREVAETDETKHSELGEPPRSMADHSGALTRINCQGMPRGRQRGHLVCAHTRGWGCCAPLHG